MPQNEKILSDHHRQMLKDESGIKDDVINARGYYTEESSRKLANMGFSQKQRRPPVLVLPLYRPGDTRPYLYQTRPDDPRTDDKGRVMKYEYPYGQRPILDCPPVTLMKRTIKSNDPFYITEGAKKADAAVSKGVPCMSLAGVWNWKMKTKEGGRLIIPEFDEVGLKDREVRLCFDNDIMEKENVWWALIRLAGILENRQAKVRYVILPPGPKCGLDDFLNTKGVKPVDLERLMVDVLPEPPNMRYTPDDRGMAERMSDMLGEELFYDNHNGLWYFWNGSLWVPDRPGNFAVKMISHELRVLREEAQGLSDEVPKGAKQSPRAKHFALACRYGDCNRITGVEKLARAELAEPDPGLDSKPDLLCCLNGTLDLPNGEFREHRAEDRLTCMTRVEYDPLSEAPEWTRFMEDRFPNQDTRKFIQRMCGLFLTGNSPEKAFFILQGESNCGKTVFIELIHWLLGTYGGKVDKATLTKGKGSDNSKQLEKSAELVGRRYIYVDESGNKDEIDDAFIKEVTGGEATLKFRRLYQQAEEARAEFTLVLATNFKPRMVGNDEAAWRRCKLVHFGEPVPTEQIIGNYQSVLRKEGSGILNWMYEGYLDWAANGLNPPEEVERWTLGYQDENDPVGQFIRECYDIGPEVDGFVSTAELSLHYAHWTEENEVTVKVMNDNKQFARHIKQRWPVTKEGTRNAKQRGFHHMAPKQTWRGERPTDEEVMEI